MQRKEYCPSHTYECLTLTYSYEVDDGSQVLTKDVYQKKCVPRDANNCQSYCVTHRLLGAVYCKVNVLSRQFIEITEEYFLFKNLFSQFSFLWLICLTLFIQSKISLLIILGQKYEKSRSKISQQVVFFRHVLLRPFLH